MNLAGWVKSLMFVVIATASTQAHAEWQIRSGEQPVQMIELYTSQGCSSCPPADRWLSQWKDSPRLWKEVIPMAFHVDYWDWIGWKDRFADPRFAERQRQHKDNGALGSVYTPGFVVDGKEWRGWFSRRSLPKPNVKHGELVASIDGMKLLVNFFNPHNHKAQVHSAVLGFDLETPVNRGENTNKTLAEDFVVLWYRQQPFSEDASFRLPDPKKLNARRLGLVVWVTQQGSSEPIQIAGDWWPR